MFTRIAICLGLFSALLLPHSPSAESEDSETLRQRAEAGDPFAQYELGEKLEYGEMGFAHDPDQAKAWYAKAVKGFQTEAESGNAKAMYYLAQCYVSRRGVDENDDLALKWYQLAADANFPEAQLALGYRYLDGRGVPEDIPRGLALIRETAAQGLANAQERLGRLHAEGEFLKKDEAAAAEWYRKAYASYRKMADSGDLNALWMLAIFQLNGFGMPVNDDRGIELLVEAADKGHGFAPLTLAYGYETGFGEKKTGRDPEKAQYWLKRAGEQASISHLLNWVNQYQHGEERNFEKAMTFLRMAAERGSARAQYELALALMGQMDGRTRDYEKAVFWLSAAAEQDYLPAYGILAQCYENGWGVEKNADLARQWKKKSFQAHLTGAEAGNIADIQSIASAYEHGYGVEQNIAAAKAWYTKAAETGDRWSQYELGRLLQHGPKKDYTKAIEWYRKAAAHEYGLEAQVALGKCYEEGVGVEQDYTEAAEWYLKVAGNDKISNSYSKAEAMYRLSRLYKDGRGVRRDTERAEELMWQAADEGYWDAKRELGYSYKIHEFKNDAWKFVDEWIW